VTTRIRYLRRDWFSQDSDRKKVFLSVDGRISLTEFRALLAERAHGVPDEEIEVNWGTAVWYEDATAEELAERAEQRRRSAERTEEWERGQLSRLAAKYPEELAELLRNAE
jgi:hypothetical protein